MYHPIYKFNASGSEWDTVNHPNDQKRILGGKGAALVSMCALGMPVPPGWTITTEVCNQWRKLKNAEGDLATLQMNFMHPLLEDSIGHHVDMAEEFGFPPLVSVRSGAPISMPGMMDTVLNVGLTLKNMPEWVERLGERAALDSYRRLIQMLGSTAFGVPHEDFEAELDKWRVKAGVTEDSALEPKYLNEVVAGYLEIFKTHTGQSFPSTFAAQLDAAIRAVFDSWDNDRAVYYRKMNNIDDDMGTAVTVQAMVFGNMGDTSGSGVLFTRDPSTGEKAVMAEYLANAQGEDVVAGIRTPEKLVLEPPIQDAMYGDWRDDLYEICVRLEADYRDMVDVEFTVQEGKLYILQSRAGKRSARAAIKIAYDLVHDSVITVEEAVGRITAEQYKIARRPGIDPAFDKEPNLTGLPACPGVVTGIPVFSSEAAVNCNEPCILVTHETTPDDIAGMNKAVGILTQTGGATSHAAVVARAMDTPCIVGCMDMELQGELMGVNGVVFALSGQPDFKLTIDGSTGRVWVGEEVPLVDTSDNEEMQAFAMWCMQLGNYCGVSLMNPDDPDEEALITVSEWWGDTDVLGVVFDELAGLKDRSKLTLDLRPPVSLMPEGDRELFYAFEPEPKAPDPFLVTAVGVLLGRSDLKGLQLMCDGLSATDVQALRTAGYSVARVPETIADLMGSATMAPSPEFIENVIGGEETWDVLRKALLCAGFEMKHSRQAVQPDYAVFKQLQQSA